MSFLDDLGELVSLFGVGETFSTKSDRVLYSRFNLGAPFYFTQLAMDTQVHNTSFAKRRTPHTCVNHVSLKSQIFLPLHL